MFFLTVRILRENKKYKKVSSGKSFCQNLKFVSIYNNIVMIRTSKEKIKEAGTKSSKKIPKMVVKHATATQPLPISTKKI